MEQGFNCRQGFGDLDVTTKPTHARGPGGVALALPVMPPSPSVPLIVWPGTFDPTVGDGYPAAPGAIGYSLVAGIAWIHALANAPNTWVNVDTLWQLVERAEALADLVTNISPITAQLEALAAFEAALAAAMAPLVEGVASAGSVTFPAFALLADNQTLTVGGFTYEVQKTGGYVYTVGTVTVDCRACTDANSVAIAFGHAIGVQVGSTVSASGPVGAVLSLAAMAPGDGGNIPITGTIPATFLGMSGGANPVVNLSPIVHILQNLTVKEHVAPIDSDTLLYYDFRENATPIKNHGAAGDLDIVWGVQQKRQKDGFSACMDFGFTETGGGLITDMTTKGESPSITLSCWIYPTAFPNPATIPGYVFAPLIAKGYYDAWVPPYLSVTIQMANGAALDSSLGRMQFAIMSAGGIVQNFFAPGGSQGYLVLNEWQFVALTYDATTGTLSAYKNGVLLGTMACPIGGIDWGDHGRWSLGCDGEGNEGFQYARIAEVRVEKTVRSQAYLQDLYSRGSGQWAKTVVSTI